MGILISVLVLAGYLLLMILFFRCYRKSKGVAFNVDVNEEYEIIKKNSISNFFMKTNIKTLVWLSLAFSLLIKVGLCFVANSHGDLGIFSQWSVDIINMKPWNYYISASAPRDYVPGYLYVLSFFGLFRAGVGLDEFSIFYLFLLKIPAIVCDLLTGYVIYLIGKKYTNDRLALFIGFLYVINPFVIINSSVWGQMDSIPTLFMLLTLKCMVERKITPVCVWFSMAVLFKFQAVFIAPIVLLYIVLMMIKNKNNARVKFPIAIISCVLAYYIVALPWTIIQISQGDIMFPFKIYFNQFGTYEYFTLNAFNLYGLLGYNYVSIGISKSAGLLVTIIIVILISAIAIIFYLNQRDKAGLFAMSAFIIVGIFLFAFKMHERYLYPAMLFILLAGIIYNDKRLYWTYIGMSGVHFLNLSLLLSSKNDTFDFGSSAYMFTGSLLLIAMFIYFVYVCWTIAFKKYVVPLDYVRRVNNNGEINIDFAKVNISTKSTKRGDSNGQ